MRKLLLLVFLLIHVGTRAQIFLVDTNTHYYEDFNLLDSNGTAATRLPAGWVFREWGSAANSSYRAGTGSANASDTYSFGAAQSRDRALGSLASGTLTKIVYGLMFINQSGADINAVSISYRGEQWRRGGSGGPDSLRCQFTTLRGSDITDSAVAGWSEPAGLRFRSVSTVSGSAALNGNDSSRLLQASFPLMLHPGDTLWLRWMDLNAAGSDDGLAIDSLSIDFSNGPVTHSNHPQLLRFSPDSNASGIGPDVDLRVEFDRAVRAGTGCLSVWDLGTNQITRIPATDGQPGASGREYVFSYSASSPGSRYLVRFDSAAFDSLGYLSTGLFSADWVFRAAPVAVPNTGSVGGASLRAMADGRLLFVKSQGEADADLVVVRSDGRLVSRQRIRVSAPFTVLNPMLPSGGCYLATVHCDGLRLRTWLCVP